VTKASPITATKVKKLKIAPRWVTDKAAGMKAAIR
jgi:hypothetical protein